MKVKVLIGFLIFLIVINLATIGSFLYYQWRKPPEPPVSPGGPGRQPLRELNFNRNQRHQLRNLLLEFKVETEPLNNQIHILENIAELRLEISKKIIDKFYDTRNILTPMQQKHFFNALMNQRPGPMGPGPHFRKGRRGLPNPQPPSEDLRLE
jgi:Spy/CpxP family protein refolding chaperone